MRHRKPTNEQGHFTVPDFTKVDEALSAIAAGIRHKPTPEVLRVLHDLHSRNLLAHEWSTELLNAGREDIWIWRVGGFLLLSRPHPNGNSRRTYSLRGSGMASDLELVQNTVGGSGMWVDGDTKRNIMALSDCGWTAFEDRGHANYIYDVDEQTRLVGAKFARRRSYLAAIKRRGGGMELRELDLADHTIAQQVNSVYLSWLEGRETEVTLRNEGKVLGRLLASVESTALRACGTYMDGRLQGFATFEVHGPHANVHFVHALRDGAIYAATWQALFEFANLSGASKLNAGFDGGSSGLRYAKTALAPERLHEAHFIARLQ